MKRYYEITSNKKNRVFAFGCEDEMAKQLIEHAAAHGKNISFSVRHFIKAGLKAEAIKVRK